MARKTGTLASDMKRTSIDFPVELKERIDEYCFHEKISMADLIRQLLQQKLDEAERGKENEPAK